MVSVLDQAKLGASSALLAVQTEHMIHLLKEDK